MTKLDAHLDRTSRRFLGFGLNRQDTETHKELALYLGWAVLYVSVPLK